MKRFILAAIAVMIGFVSCEKDGTNAIIGTWEATSLYMNIEGIEMDMDIKEVAGSSIEMTFHKDGTVTMTESIDGESYSETYDYTYSSNTLTLSYEDESVSIPATISGDKLTMKVTGEMMEVEGFEGEVQIIFTRK